MKQPYNMIFIMAGIIFLAYSCQQVNDDAPEQYEAEVEEVVRIIAVNLLTVDIIGGEGNQSFSSGRFLGGEDSYLSSATHDKDKNAIPMIACIRSLHLEPGQLQDVRRLLFVFENCKSNIMVSYKEEIRKLIVSLEGRRLELLENLRNGDISREVYNTHVEELRNNYRISLEELKDSYKEELRPCLKSFVSRLQINLGREDWLKFRKCIKDI